MTVKMTATQVLLMPVVHRAIAMVKQVTLPFAHLARTASAHASYSRRQEERAMVTGPLLSFHHASCYLTVLVLTRA